MTIQLRNHGMEWNHHGFCKQPSVPRRQEAKNQEEGSTPQQKKKNQKEGSIQNRTESYSSSAEEKMRSGAAIRPGAAGKMKQQPAQAWQHTQEEIKKKDSWSWGAFMIHPERERERDTHGGHGKGRRGREAGRQQERRAGERRSPVLLPTSKEHKCLPPPLLPPPVAPSRSHSSSSSSSICVRAVGRE